MTWSLLLWPAVTLAILWRVDTWVTRLLDLRDPELSDEKPAPPIPNDLVAFAMMESEKIAQDDVLKVIQERYDVLRDWNKVRHAVGVAPTDGDA